MSTIKLQEVDILQKSKINIRQTTVAMCEIAVCAALLCVLSPISIPTPLNVGFTLQVLIVLLSALILKPLHALAAQVIYTLLGIIGLPVFSNWQSGFGVIAGPTGGFIIGFIFASFFVSLLKGKPDNKWVLPRYILTAVVVGIPCIYLPGILGFMLATGRDFGTAFMLVAATFIPVDLIKCVVAALFAVPVNRALSKIK